MPVTAITTNYEFPSRSRQELYGDKLLVSVYWEGNLTFCAPAMFPVPRTMTWAAFLAGVVEPWAAMDPDYQPGGSRNWTLDGQAFVPEDDKALVELGIGHKSLLSFRG